MKEFGSQLLSRISLREEIMVVRARPCGRELLRRALPIAAWQASRGRHGGPLEGNGLKSILNYPNPPTLGLAC